MRGLDRAGPSQLAVKHSHVLQDICVERTWTGRDIDYLVQSVQGTDKLSVRKKVIRLVCLFLGVCSLSCFVTAGCSPAWGSLHDHDAHAQVER